MIHILKGLGTKSAQTLFCQPAASTALSPTLCEMLIPDISFFAAGALTPPKRVSMLVSALFFDDCQPAENLARQVFCDAGHAGKSAT
jgi:hypothetical protein